MSLQLTPTGDRPVGIRSTAMRQSAGMTADDFRQLALALEGAIEREHMNHPDFRVNGRIFATLHSNDQWGMVTVSPDEQRALMHEHPAIFVPSSGAWGRQGCTNVRLESADKATVRGAMLLAWQSAVAMKPTRPKKRITLD